MLPLIYTWLSASAPVVALVGDRIYRHGHSPAQGDRPYLVWMLVAGVPDNNLSDLPPSDRMTVQVDCWHPTDNGVEALATAVRNALEPRGHMTAIPVDTRDMGETQLYRISLQFDFFVVR